MTDQIQTLLGNKRGYDVLRNPLLNKGSAFTPAERAALGLEGILPPQFNDMALQAQRTYANIQRQTTPIDKYVALAALQDRNEHLFYRVVRDHIEEFMPIIYTPTVGQATRDFSHVFQRSRGVWITPAMRGGIATALRNAAMERRIRLIVATDNESILGIGDQGAGGIGISIGKLVAVYRGGRHSSGRDAAGQPRRRHRQPDVARRSAVSRAPACRGCAAPQYDALIDEFVPAVKAEFPGAVLQWEDFRKENALTIMNKYRKVLPSFNDDIQGTGAVALAGLLGACRVSGRELSDERIVVFGAGAGGLGIARQIRAGYAQLGLDDAADPRAHRGARQPRPDRQRQRNARRVQERARVVAGAGAPRRSRQCGASAASTTWSTHFKPTVLIGASGQAGSFPEALIRRVAAQVERPIIFPLSNPNDNTEARPEDIVRWTRRSRDRRGRQSVQAGGLRRRTAPDRAGQQRVHLSRARARRTARRSARSDRQHDQRRRRVAGRLSDRRRNRRGICCFRRCDGCATWRAALRSPSSSRRRSTASRRRSIADPEAVVAANMWEPEYPVYA